MAGVEDAADRAGFFDLEDFAVAATWTRPTGAQVTLSGIFDNEFLEADLGAGVAVETSSPRLLVDSDSIGGMAAGDRLAVEGVDYRVRGLEPDGTGTTAIVLSED